MSFATAIEELLIAGADDWVPEGEVKWIAKRVGGATGDEAVRDYSLRLLDELVRSGLMVVGDLVNEAPGFRKWDLPDNAVLQRVASEWGTPTTKYMHDHFWLCNTPEGDRRAKQLLADPNRPRDLSSDPWPNPL